MTAEPAYPGIIELQLQRGATCRHFAVHDIRLRRAGSDLHVRPHAPRTLRDALVPEIADMLDGHLRMRQESAVLSRSAYELSLPGLRLGGLRLLSRISKDGSATATVRFLRAEGDPEAILTPDLRSPVPERIAIEDCALPMLRDLLCPALEVFDHVLMLGFSETDSRVLAARLKTMRARRDELSDYIELLTTAVRAGSDRQGRTGQDRPGERIELPAVPETAARSLSWSPSGGTVRGEHASILHGHHYQDAQVG